MAFSEPYELDGVTVGASELSVVSGTTSLQSITTDGVYQLWLDPVTSMAKGDTFQVRVYEKVASASTKRVIAQWTLIGAQSELFMTPPFMLMHGWDFTIQKIAGTDRAFDASIRAIGTPVEAYSITGVTITGTELSIVSGTTSLQTKTEQGIYQLFIDGVATMTKSDQFDVTLYEKVEGTGGTKRIFWRIPLAGVQAENHITPTFMLLNGWDMTLRKTAGTDRAFEASIRKIV